MIKKIFLPVCLIITGCSSSPQQDCKQMFHDNRSGIDVCMQDGWRIGEEAFVNFTIEKDSFVVKVVCEPPLFESSLAPKETWKKQYGILAGFNMPCEMVGDDHAITVDGAEGWIGTAHLPKTDKRPEFFETFVMVVHNNRQYFIDSRCPGPDRDKNIQLVEEICTSIKLANQ